MDAERSEMLEPRLAKRSMDSELPRRTPERTLIDEPTTAKLKMDTEELKRVKLRMDSEEPSKVYSCIREVLENRQIGVLALGLRMTFFNSAAFVVCLYSVKKFVKST